MGRLKASFEIAVEYEEDATDPESLCVALDRLIETATSTPGILDEYGAVSIGPFLPIEDEGDEITMNTEEKKYATAGDDFSKEGFFVLDTSADLEFYESDYAFVVPKGWLDSGRKERLEDGDLEKLFKHGGPIEGLFLKSIIAVIDKHSLWDEVLELDASSGR